MKMLLLVTAMRAMSLGQCDPDNVKFGLEVESVSVPLDATEIELDLTLFEVHEDFDVLWIAGIEWDPGILRFEGYRYPEGLEPLLFHRFFLGPPREGVAESTWENPGCGAVDFRIKTFNPYLYRPKDGRAVLVRLVFTVLQAAPTAATTQVRVLPRTPNDSEARSWPTAVWFCGSWRTFLPEDNRPMIPGTVSFVAPFVRGDVDRNQEVELSDVLAILSSLFLGQRRVPCPPAADVDQSGSITITDAVYLVTHLFKVGPPPAPPYPSPGFDGSGAGCEPGA